MKSINKEDFDDVCKESRKPHFLDHDYFSYNEETENPCENNQQNTIFNSSMKLKNTQELVKPNETINKNEEPYPTLDPNMTNSSSNVIEINLGPKVECVYSLLDMLGQNNNNEMAVKFFELSKNRETCVALRRSGCVSILVQLLHSDTNETVRKNAGAALHNIVHCHTDDKNGRREIRVLKLIEQLMEFCDVLKKYSNAELHDMPESHPINSIGTLMKISFDEEHRHAMCLLGALQTISNLVQLDHDVHGSNSKDINCITLRRYAGMTLTNLTFGDGNNKALLCSNKKFMKSFVEQIDSSSDELIQVTASVLRNLSWRADANVKQVLSEINTVKILTKAAMKCAQENTLKSILSALWNLSNHCSANKAAFCECEGAISFLIKMLQYDSPNRTLAIVENAGGILRNISSHIAVKEEYRQILRRHNCLGILLQQLKSPSLTIVSNASGTLGNLSSNCPEDQKFLRDNSAIPMLRSLIYSKHKMISTGSTIALRNLLNFQKTGLLNQSSDSISKSMDLKELPSLNVRKQRAFQQDLMKNLSNNCVVTLPTSIALTKTLSVDENSMMYGKSHVSNVSNDIFNASNITQKSISNDEKQTYQETDLDQPVNFSIRYAENAAGQEEERCTSIDEDYVQTYFTEGTPKYSSNSGSVSDLRHIEHNKPYLKVISKPIHSESFKVKNNMNIKKITPVNSGLFTPEKPINYCEEGTPSGTSRCDSLSNLSEVQTTVYLENNNDTKSTFTPTKTVKLTNNENGFTLETPLIFSRNSSTDSLNSAGSVCIADDKSSVVSDFSRLASGAISPSDLPDSPIQDILCNSAKRGSNLVTCKTETDLEDETKIENNNKYINNTNKAHIENKTKNVIDDDNYLLEQTIIIGIQSSTGKGSDLDELPIEYLTEDTPIPLSKVGSSSNLSHLSIETVNENDKSGSSPEDQILEAIVQTGIESTYNKSRQNIGNSLDSLQREERVDYSSMHDEINVFGIERTSFSAMSELSAITVGCEALTFVNYKRPEERLNETKKSETYDTVSSISSDSVEDNNFLNQAIIAGTQKLVTNFDNSYSSIDSCDDQTNQSLLDQIVQSGMKKVMSQEKNENEHDDQLLEEVIKTGMDKTIRSSNANLTKMHTYNHQQQTSRNGSIKTNALDLEKVGVVHQKSNTESDMFDDNTKYDIHFRIGERVSNIAESKSNRFFSSLMNSTIVMEAKKFTTELENYSSNDILLHCDLNNVQPPSDLNCFPFSTTSYNVLTDFSNEMCRTKRKLNGVEKSNNVHSTSLEYMSIDNINPPSVMNDLLGSMPSVESITPNNHTMTILNKNRLLINEQLEPRDSSTIQTVNDNLCSSHQRRDSERFKTYTITNDTIHLLQKCKIDCQQTDKVLNPNKNERSNSQSSHDTNISTKNIKDRAKSNELKSKTTSELKTHCLYQLTERQGTFIKETSSDLDLPVVTTPATPKQKNKIIQKKMPLNNFISKIQRPKIRSDTTLHQPLKQKPVSPINSYQKKTMIKSKHVNGHSICGDKITGEKTTLIKSSKNFSGTKQKPQTGNHKKVVNVGSAVDTNTNVKYNNSSTINYLKNKTK